MKTKLPWHELKALVDEAGELDDDETVQVHHCKEGKDNDRCYVTRRGDTTLVHCFHCGGSGSVRDRFSRVKSAKAKGKTDGKNSTVPPKRAPYDITYTPTEWSVDALGWVGGAGLTTGEISKYGIGYSPSRGRVYIPLMREGTRVGWLARKIEADGPKYLQWKEGEFAFFINNGGDVCVIVEDILSAIKIGRKYSVIALLGTSLSGYALSKIATLFSEYVVWMDNDNPEVKMKQVQVKNILEDFADVRIVKTDKDPKEYSDEQIKNYLSP